jgi:hypothetical protein
MSQEPAPLFFVRDQLAIEIVGAPIEQHAAEIENHRPYVGHQQSSGNAAGKSFAMVGVRFPSGNHVMTRAAAGDDKPVKRNRGHSFAQIDHQIAARLQEKSQA